MVEPLPRLGRRLVRRKDADPGIEKEFMAHRAAEIRAHRYAIHTRGEIDARHFDRRFRVLEPGHAAIEAREDFVQIERVHTGHGAGERAAQRA